MPHTDPETVALEPKSKNAHNIAFLCRCFIVPNWEGALHESPIIVPPLGHKHNLLLLVFAIIALVVGSLSYNRNLLKQQYLSLPLDDHRIVLVLIPARII